MDGWRSGVPEAVLATWDRLAEAAANEATRAHLPDGLGLNEAAATVVAIAMARGILRPRPGGQPGEFEATSRSPVPLHGLLAFLSGRIEAWSAAVREVGAAFVEKAPDGAEKAPRKGRILKPLLTPQQAMMLVERVRGLETSVRAGGHRRQALQPEARVLGLAWIPDGSDLPAAVDPENAAEWGPDGGAQGLYLPIRALPDVLTALAIVAQAFFVSSGRDGRGPAGAVGPHPGSEADWDRLDVLREGGAVPMHEILDMLDRWTREA